MNQNTQSPILSIESSQGLVPWMQEHNISMAFSARRVNKLFMAGVNGAGELSFFERTFDNASGLAMDGNRLFLTGLYQVWQFGNALEPGQIQGDHDRIYLPQAAFYTGGCAAHEIAVGPGGEPVFVNTRFSCLATLSATHSFRPLWKPDFITELVPEDRCHLNGLAGNGQIRYVTACSSDNVKDGWRLRRMDGGCLIDVVENRIVLQGLSMPHSPRIHKGRVWLLNSGHGQLGYFDSGQKVFKPVITCPGFLRGLAFVGDHAIVTLSKPRASDIFSGLPLEKIMENDSPVCGVQVIDIEKGEVLHQLTFKGVVEELADVTVIDNCRHPMLLGTQTDEIKNLFSLESGQGNFPYFPDQGRRFG